MPLLIFNSSVFFFFLQGPVQDAELPLGAESSGVHHQDQDLDISPCVSCQEVNCSI